LQLVSGKLTTDSAISFSNLALQGGEFSGKGSVKSASTLVQSVVVTGLTITSTNLEISGFTTLQAATMVLTGTGKVSASSQFSLNAGASFQITSTAAFTQANAFSLVPGADAPRPTLKNDGTWSSGAAATINVDVTGAGKWQFGQGSTLVANAVAFTIGSATVSGYWKLVAVTATIPMLSGAGTVELGGGSTTTIANSAIGHLLHTSGKTTITSGSVSNLNVTNGDFIVASLSVGTLSFTSGNIKGTGTSASSSTIKASTVLISGEAPKTLSNITVSAAAINWNCVSGSCQVVNNNAVFLTASN